MTQCNIKHITEIDREDAGNPPLSFSSKASCNSNIAYMLFYLFDYDF